MTDTKPQRRRFYPAPAWLIFGLLVVEGLLWLSERFSWFSFNHHKGWTVLIAVASIGIALLLMLLWFAVALLFRWRFQFSIRSLLVLTVAVALPCSWLAVEVRSATKQKVLVESIRQSGGNVEYSLPEQGSNVHGGLLPSGLARTRWLRNLLGIDFFADVTTVWLDRSKATDAKLEPLKSLPLLQAFLLDESEVARAELEDSRGLTEGAGTWMVNIDVTDAATANFKTLKALRYLSLGGTKVTDAGLENLKGLTALQVLRLNDTDVTDAGLKNLKGLTALRSLRLDGTKVTDAGLENLKDLTGLQTLRLDNTKVTDAGLENLKGLSALQGLGLAHTEVTSAGLKTLQGLKALQVLRLDSTWVGGDGLESLRELPALRALHLNSACCLTDAGLEHLQALTQLRSLELGYTEVTDEAMKKLGRALPKCKITRDPDFPPGFPR